MNIESFDPYHIGIKLNNTLAIPIFREKLIKGMKDAGFQVIAQDQTTFNTPNEIIIKDADTRIEFNYPALALNTIGNNPKHTTALFEKLLTLLTALGYELDALAILYEVVTNINIKLDEKPSDQINRSVICNLESWKELNPNVNISGIQLELFDAEFAKQNMRILVTPNAVRPTTTLLLNLRYQHIEQDKIIDFNNKVEDRILRFVKSLGNR